MVDNYVSLSPQGASVHLHCTWGQGTKNSVVIAFLLSLDESGQYEKRRPAPHFFAAKFCQRTVTHERRRGIIAVAANARGLEAGDRYVSVISHQQLNSGNN